MDPTSRIQFGRCRIEVLTRTLVRRGERVEVQPKVFDLLLYLIEHRDRVVSPTELLDALWSGVAVTPSSLSRAIHKARVAVGDAGAEQRTIATVRQRGFRFVAPLRRDLGVPSDAAPPDFVGRDDELRRLAEALDFARSGRGGLVFLTGEPGIGKTRTAHEFATRAPAGGVEVHVSRCPEGAGAAAYWPWRRLGRSLAGGRTRSELERLAGREARDFAQVDPELARDLDARTGADPSGEEMRLRLFEGAVDVLERLARESPLALVLDDLHLADLPSLHFLCFLAHSLPALPLLVVGTFRDADLDAEQQRLVADAERCAGGRTLALRALSGSEVGRLGEKRLRVPLSTETVALLHAHSGGNPFFLGELLTLIERDGEAALSALRQGALRLPPTVRGAVEGHLGRLGEEARRLLRIAAAFGAGFTPALLARAAEASPETVTCGLAAAVDAHVLEPPGGGATGYRFAHALLRDALSQDLEASVRARLQRRIGT